MAAATVVAVAASIALGTSLERSESHAQRHPPAAAAPPAAAPSPGTAPAAPPPPPPAAFTVLTYNAGLAVGVVPHARERVAAVTEQLAREPADLVCAQELWLEDHWRTVAAALAPRLPYTHRPPPEAPAADEACSPADIAPLEACHRASCAKVKPGELASCLIGRCAHLGTSIDAGCVSCLLREPWSSLAAVREACVAGAVPARPLVGRRIVGVYAFGGSGGTGILSRAPIAETDTLVLPSTWNRRTVLYARLAASPVGPLHLFCTHLSAQLGGVPMPGGKTWESEQSDQLRDMLAFVERKTAGRPEAVIVAGDLNTGPGLPGRTSAKLAHHHDRLLAAGFSNPYAAQPEARCTYCFDNPLVGTSAGGLLIDHVLLRGFPGQARGRRVLDRAVPIEVGEARRTVPPSDHYGLSVTLTR